MSRYKLPVLPHTKILDRHNDKKETLLYFLATGEVWTVMVNVSHLWEIGVRQTQVTLSQMIRDKLIVSEKIDSGTRIYGITQTGLAAVEADLNGRPFKIGRTPPSTIKHHLIVQKVRIALEKLDASNWVAGKSLYGQEFSQVPDGVYHMFKNLLPDGMHYQSVERHSLEVELHIKSSQRMKTVLHNYCSMLGDLNDAFAELHRVRYFTPHVNAMKRLIDKYVAANMRDRFTVDYVSTTLKPYERNKSLFEDV